MKMIGRTFFASTLAIAAVSGAVVYGAGVTAAPAFAQTEAVKLVSEMMVEKTEAGADGVEKTVLKSPKETMVTPGITLNYTNTGAAPAGEFRCGQSAAERGCVYFGCRKLGRTVG